MKEVENHPFNQGSSGRRRSLLIVVSIVCIGIIAAFWWLARPKTSLEDEAEQNVVVSVRIAAAERRTIAAQASALGTIWPVQQATVSAKISAPIKQMALLKNRSVREGEVIAVLESRDLQSQRSEAFAALNEARITERNVAGGTIPQTAAQDDKALRDARANLATARATLERRRVLAEQGGISQKDLEAAQLAVTTAENDLRLAESTVRLRAATLNPNDRALAAAHVKEAEERIATLDAQLSYASIRAPFDGVITDQFQFKGEFANAGARLFSIANLNELVVKASFADTVAAQLKVGDEAEVRPADIPGESIKGRVSLISRASDPQNRTVEVWVNLKNSDGRLRANSAAEVIVTTSVAAGAIVIPAAAVTLDAANASEGVVMTVDDKSIAHEVKVRIGIRSGSMTQITEGLKGGESVVIEGNYALPDGTKVQVTENGRDKESKTGGKDEGDEKGEKEKGQSGRKGEKD